MHMHIGSRRDVFTASRSDISSRQVLSLSRITPGFSKFVRIRAEPIIIEEFLSLNSVLLWNVIEADISSDQVESELQQD